MLRYAIADRSFAWFTAIYVFGAVWAVVFELAFKKFVPPVLTLQTRTKEADFLLEGLLKDITSYLLAAQVGVLGVISIAVGLVTIIGQRAASSTDVRLYYEESLSYEVVSSSIALAMVLAVQLLWPLQYVAYLLGLGDSMLASKLSLTMLHATWLALNLAALAHFISVSLLFLEPLQRRLIRQRSTANRVIPYQFKTNLLRALYFSAGRGLVGPEPADETIAVFGLSLGSSGVPEIEQTFHARTELYDVHVSLMQWAVRSWWRRCSESHEATAQARVFSGPQLVFNPNFGVGMQGRTIWCRREGGLPLSFLERLALRISFQFRKVEE